MSFHQLAAPGVATTLLALVCLAAATNSSTAEDELLCRARGVLLPLHEFRLHTCALCYAYMHPNNFRPALRWREVMTHGALLLGNANDTLVANVSDSESPLLQSFTDMDAILKWQTCCWEAEKCCLNMLITNTSTERGWCPRTWDGWQCWPDAPPHSVQLRPCPSFIRLGSAEHNCPLFAEKTCDDGGWRGFSFNKSQEWTNYTTCSVADSMKTRVYISLAAYAGAVTALLPALIIFQMYRQLQGHRISLHKNLFTSLLLNAVFEIWFKADVLMTEFEDGPKSIIKQNGHYCKVLLIITKYFRLSNYLWMFCEGFYLHRLISAAFAEEKSLRIFYAIGWGFPVLFVALYAVLRDAYSDYNCWAFPTQHTEWVLYVPCLLSLAINMIFLVDIIRILVTKLRAANCHEPSQYRKAVRATLVLVPLFGLHFIVTMYRPQSGTCNWGEYYVYADYLLDGLQGAFVALIFCYVNGEVHALMRRSYRNFVELRNPSLSGPSSQFLGASTVTTTHAL